MKKSKQKPKKKRHVPLTRYEVCTIGKSFEIRHAKTKEIFGPYKTRQAAEEAVKILNARLPTAGVFE